MKRLPIAALLIGLAVLTTCSSGPDEVWLTATAQKQPAEMPANRPDLTAPTPGALAAVALSAPLPAETILKIRDLQLADANRRLRMKDLEAEYEKLQAEQRASVQAVDAIVRDAAKAVGVDLDKYTFDIRTSKFTPREKPAASPTPGK
jgi:hypothetical protein